MSTPISVSLHIKYTWDGKKVTDEESAAVHFQLDASGMTVQLLAPFYNDMAPSCGPGPTDLLWEYEVVELFLFGDKDNYLEIEFGPHGHYLVIQLAGIRHIIKKLLPLRYEAQIIGKYWRATSHIPVSFLPTNLSRVNAYAIHGQEADRRYLAAFPVPGLQPDFHQPRFFGDISIDCPSPSTSR